MEWILPIEDHGWEVKMNKKLSLKEELEKTLTERYERWDDIFQFGTNDPSWADGVNLNLVRNHILYIKSQIEEQLDKQDYPDIYYKDVPPKVDYDYIARPKEIKEKAVRCFNTLEQYPHLEEVLASRMYLDDKELMNLGIFFLINRVKELKEAIEKDDYVTMRRLSRDSDTFLKSLEEAYHKIEEYKLKEERQLSLFEMM